jgi:hypothetical protein
VASVKDTLEFTIMLHPEGEMAENKKRKSAKLLSFKNPDRRPRTGI